MLAWKLEELQILVKTTNFLVSNNYAVYFYITVRFEGLRKGKGREPV